MRVYTADLHIHTCLSACAELDMTPRRIVQRAVQKGLDIIAISDHNSAENIEATLRIAGQMGIAVFPSMEITSAEEAHVLAIFGEAEGILKMQGIVYENLPALPLGRADRHVVVNERDEVMGFNTRCLVGACGLSIGELVSEIHEKGGFAVASHIDRGAFSLSSQFGFIPEGIGFDAFEVIDSASAAPLLVGYRDMPLVCSSDAHFLDDIGSRTTELTMMEASFAEFGMALKGVGGRHVSCV